MYLPSSYLFSYLPTYLCMRPIFLQNWVTKVKPNMNSVEVHAQLSNNRHPEDGVQVGAGSVWPLRSTMGNFLFEGHQCLHHVNPSGARDFDGFRLCLAPPCRPLILVKPGSLAFTKKICHVCGGHLISMNFPPTIWEGHYAYL
jgi:hypothetical protein